MVVSVATSSAVLPSQSLSLVLILETDSKKDTTSTWSQLAAGEEERMTTLKMTFTYKITMFFCYHNEVVSVGQSPGY